MVELLREDAETFFDKQKLLSVSVEKTLHFHVKPPFNSEIVCDAHPHYSWFVQSHTDRTNHTDLNCQLVINILLYCSGIIYTNSHTFYIVWEYFSNWPSKHTAEIVTYKNETDMKKFRSLR